MEWLMRDNLKLAVESNDKEDVEKIKAEMQVVKRRRHRRDTGP